MLSASRSTHDVLRHELLNLPLHLLFRQLFQRREIELLDQPAMQAHLGVEQLVAEQRIHGLGRIGFSISGAGFSSENTGGSAGAATGRERRTSSVRSTGRWRRRSGASPGAAAGRCDVRRPEHLFLVGLISPFAQDEA